VDFVARYGGEEFLIMMPETEIEGATEFAERGADSQETGGRAAPRRPDHPEPGRLRISHAR